MKHTNTDIDLTDPQKRTLKYGVKHGVIDRETWSGGHKFRFPTKPLRELIGQGLMIGDEDKARPSARGKKLAQSL